MKKAALSAVLFLAALTLAAFTLHTAQAATYNIPTGPITPLTISMEGPTTATYISWFVPLAFQIHGSWDGYVNHYSVLYKLDNDSPILIDQRPFLVKEVDRNFSLTLGPLSEGSHSLQVLTTVGGMYRTAPNSTILNSGDFTSQASVTFSVNTTGQAEISILSPQNEVYSINKEIPVEFALSKSASLSSMGFMLDEQSNVTVPRNTTLYGPIPDGVHTLKVFAVYSDVLPAYSTVNFTVDTTPPKVSLLSLKNDTYNSTDIPLVFTVNETAKEFTYILDGDVHTIYGNATLTTLQDGDHQLTVYATDGAGNAAPSETVDFKVSVPVPPEMAYGVLPPMVVVLVGGFCVLIYLEKRKQTASRKRD